MLTGVSLRIKGAVKPEEETFILDSQHYLEWWYEEIVKQHILASHPRPRLRFRAQLLSGQVIPLKTCTDY